MKHLVPVVLLLAVVFSLQAQDGIYGSFTLGQKIVNMDALNDKIHELNPNFDGIDFVNNYWLIGGEGHIILAKHFVVGGKGVVMWNEKSTTQAIPKETMKIVGGMGVGTLGYAFLGGDEKQIRIIPQVGLGASSFLFQQSEEFDGEFDDVFADDHRDVLTRMGFALDLCLSGDWYIKLIELVKIIPGLGFGPLIHADVGYTIIAANSEWVRDFNDSGFGNEPDLSFGGFYFNLGLGIGLSSSRD